MIRVLNFVKIMGKTKGLSFEDVYKRCNFLYQAADESLERNPSDISLCRFYLNTMTVIARRQGIHLHPDIKRRICKRCCLLLKPGISAIYRVKKKRQKMTVVTCLGCGTLRRYVYKKDDVQHIDRPNVWIDTVVNGEQVGSKQQQEHHQKHHENKGENKNKEPVEATEIKMEHNETKSCDHIVTDQTNHKIQCKDLSVNNEEKVT